MQFLSPDAYERLVSAEMAVFSKREQNWYETRWNITKTASPLCEMGDSKFWRAKRAKHF